MQNVKVWALSLVLLFSQQAIAWLEAPNNNFTVTVYNNSDMYVRFALWGLQSGHNSENDYGTPLLAPGESGVATVDKNFQFKRFRVYYYADDKGKILLDDFKDRTMVWDFDGSYKAPDYPRVVFVYGTKNNKLQDFVTAPNANGNVYPTRWIAVWTGDIDVKAVPSIDAANKDTGVNAKVRCFKPNDKATVKKGDPYPLISF
ncbi:MAG: hypothetical protein ACXWL2_00790 [Candidatus Chromulinivorax sp.]